MITIPLLICLIGLAVWAIFAKTKLADAWIADVGRICFWTGLFWTLAPYAGKVAFGVEQ